MICALLSWYHEHPRWLAETVESLEKVPGLEHIVALDGAYKLYPHGEPQSQINQAEAIAWAAERIGIAHTIRAPEECWDDEMEKRTALFELGEQMTGPNDWYFVIDADEVVTEAPPDLLDRLDAADPRDVAELTVNEPNQFTGPAINFKWWRRKPTYPLRMMFRAIRGLHVAGNHYTYCTPDGRKLWGHNTRELEPALDLTDLAVYHRAEERESGRRADQFVYYWKRDRDRVELGQCARCDAPATRLVETEWGIEERPAQVIEAVVPVDLTAGRIEVCEDCLPGVREENSLRLRELGFDPKTMRPLPQLVQ